MICLYNYAGEPWKRNIGGDQTACTIRLPMVTAVMRTMDRHRPVRFQLSGFMPFVVGPVRSGPLFNKMTLTLENGKPSS